MLVSSTKKRCANLYVVFFIVVFAGCNIDEDLLQLEAIFDTAEQPTLPNSLSETDDEDTMQEEEEEEGEEETQPTQDQILVFTKTEGFRHASIDKGLAALVSLGNTNNFQVDQTEDALNFNENTLNAYQLVLFLNTTGNVLNESQQAVFEKYIQQGGSYMGIHSASDTEFNWPWYGQLVGAYFNDHPEIQNATMTVIDENHASTGHLDDSFTRNDEWYNFREINSDINVLLNLEESSYQGGTQGENHPIAWFQEFDGGRSFYTGGGHTEAAYDEPDFQQHLLGGIEYCLGR